MLWLAGQVMRTVDDLASQDAERPAIINPRPPGQYVPGGAAEAVLTWLQARPSARAWWSMHQIINGTGRSAKACCWAVIYLHRTGRIDRERDVQNSRYLRYRAKP